MGFWSKIGNAGKSVVKAPVDQAKSLLGVDQAKENFDWMGRLVKGLLPSSIKVGMVETFEHALDRQRLSEEDLGKIYTNHVLKFWICAIMLLTGLAVGISYVVGGQLLVLLPVSGFSAVCLSQMFSGSFRAYQIANRKFCDVSEWVSKRGVWIPLTFELPAKKLVAKSKTSALVPRVSPSKSGVPSSKNKQKD